MKPDSQCIITKVSVIFTILSYINYSAIEHIFSNRSDSVQITKILINPYINIRYIEIYSIRYWQTLVQLAQRFIVSFV